MNAHSRWWDFIAPQLLGDYRVAAMDLTGMGDSDYRYTYEAKTYASEIVAVCDAAGFDSDVTVVGHSFGGVMAVKAANLHPDRFGALVLVDSGIRHPDEPPSNQPQMGGGRPKVYPTGSPPKTGFRLYPPQPCENRYIMEYIARHSLLQVDGGWAWKFDEELPLTTKGTDRAPEDYTGIPIPMGIVYGAESKSFTASTLDYTLELIGRDVPVVAVENAQHHVFLDQPLAFIDALKQVLGSPRAMTGLIGICLLPAIAWLLSTNRRSVNWRTVGGAFALQVAVGAQRCTSLRGGPSLSGSPTPPAGYWATAW